MFIKASDTISGQEAKAVVEIDGVLQDLFYAKKVEAKFEKTKTPVKSLGKRGEQSKATGWKGTGSMTVYYVSSVFRELAIKYIKTGIDTYFKLILTNEDTSSATGKQTIVLYECNIDSTFLSKFDVDSEVLEEDLEFTFGDADILNKFTAL